MNRESWIIWAQPITTLNCRQIKLNQLRYWNIIKVWRAYWIFDTCRMLCAFRASPCSQAFCERPWNTKKSSQYNYIYRYQNEIGMAVRTTNICFIHSFRCRRFMNINAVTTYPICSWLKSIHNNKIFKS